MQLPITVFAHILGTLDDKNELNRKMNQTLEEMARAIFKSWFVDFDPVLAKVEGRMPHGMDAPSLDGVNAVGLAMAAGLYLAVRSERVTHTAALRLGLVFEVVMCLAVSIAVPWFYVEAYGHVPHITFTTVVIVLYPLLVPSPPRLTLLVALAAAATAPAGIAVVALLGDHGRPLADYIGSGIFPLMAAAIAENNPTALEAIYTELLATIDADEGPDASTLLEPETINLYEENSPQPTTTNRLTPRPSTHDSTTEPPPTDPHTTRAQPKRT